MKRWNSFRGLILLVALMSGHAASAQEPALPLIEPHDTIHIEAESRSEQLYRAAFVEIAQHYDHYRAQAFRYQWIDRIARLLILLASTAAALILALTESKRAKHAAIVLSMVVAGTQAADQQFQWSKMREASWRTAVDLNRVLSEFREEWAFSDGASSNPDEALALVRLYRERFNAAVEAEMKVSLAPVPPLR